MFSIRAYVSVLLEQRVVGPSQDVGASSEPSHDIRTNTQLTDTLAEIDHLIKHSQDDLGFLLDLCEDHPDVNENALARLFKVAEPIDLISRMRR